MPSPGLPSSIPPSFDSRRESEFPISLHEPSIAGRKGRFSYEYDVGPYEMDSPVVHQRVPYERPLSAQELEGTRVQVQELDAHTSATGLGIETREVEMPNRETEIETPDKDK